MPEQRLMPRQIGFRAAFSVFYTVFFPHPCFIVCRRWLR
ncbi:hypothetical protein DDI_0980 [Dickeya dianthicola RNS04.9]|nr:hypothetical protein DDI_0980 [Dickeya dianthicola RNS04.9]